jgi:hypothetical protein
MYSAFHALASARGARPIVRVWPCAVIVRSHRDSTEAAIILSFGSPSSPTEGLKIAVFPGRRHQTRHLDFVFFGC